MSRRCVPLFLFLVLAAVPVCAQMRVGGSEFLAKDLVFTVLDDASRATGSGKLADGCAWTLALETAIAQRPHEECVSYYYRTTVTLSKACPEPKEPSTQRSERTVLAGMSCPKKEFTPETEGKILSLGTNANGSRQEVLVQPDGTRVTVVSSPE
ncbi:MAG: hypothetical protein ACRD2J_03570, partial [Thermoanaerobaculia bacterium]